MKDFYELSAIFDKRKSFYGKALVRIEDNGDKTLLSYCTKIMRIDTDGNVVKRYDHRSSNTTTRHIKEFCRQYNVNYEDYLNA